MNILRLWLSIVIGFLPYSLFAGDTISVFMSKIVGEDINYFSPMRQFATKALLTRANGAMPISWSSQIYSGTETTLTYEFLIGHSTGTSSGVREFDLSLNGVPLLTITTTPKKTSLDGYRGGNSEGISYEVSPIEFDVNGDLFGFLRITIPAARVREQADFSLTGRDAQSRDWMMVFMYSRNLKYESEITNLVLKQDRRRQLNVYMDYPLSGQHYLELVTNDRKTVTAIHQGYNKISVSAWDDRFHGPDTLIYILDSKDTIRQPVVITPVANYEFHIIHHSHNDIGYSHLQTEVEKIQTENIRSALRWTSVCDQKGMKPVWHIESLWAVENFLRTASEDEIKAFESSVNKGNIVLSANYANILTGLCQPEEQRWALEYAQHLEEKFDFDIRNVMITDIPGITWSALKAYVEEGIPYLSIGPNYIETQPDHGDRVGGVIREQGDQIYYWKPDSTSEKKLLVWTAGKGYSYFHNITEQAKAASWESRISRYCGELSQKNYPYKIVQLRYTKNADNGPVDTNLCAFVETWNETYLTPRLEISSIDKLFARMEAEHGHELPVVTGEITPYWEDGAWSTAAEELENRELALRTIAMEKYAREKKLYKKYEQKFYSLHRNIVMFHEHTWGSWCSISDPELAFTTAQWEIKKSFLDSARSAYNELSLALNFHFVMPEQQSKMKDSFITDFEIDPANGGLRKIMVGGKNVVDIQKEFSFFEMIYSTGTDPSVLHRSSEIAVGKKIENEKEKQITVAYDLHNFSKVSVTYTLMKETGKLKAHFSFDKKEERGKESLHIAMPFAMDKPTLSYGSADKCMTYNRDQLPGSNKDFICAEDRVVLQDAHFRALILSPQVNLFEVGAIIDESRTTGAKVWKTQNEETSELFLYVLNNYWHTNFKAWQSGHLEFDVELNINHQHP